MSSQNPKSPTSDLHTQAIALRAGTEKSLAGIVFNSALSLSDATLPVEVSLRASLEGAIEDAQREVEALKGKWDVIVDEIRVAVDKAGKTRWDTTAAALVAALAAFSWDRVDLDISSTVADRSRLSDVVKICTTFVFSMVEHSKSASIPANSQRISMDKISVADSDVQELFAAQSELEALIDAAALRVTCNRVELGKVDQYVRAAKASLVVSRLDEGAAQAMLDVSKDLVKQIAMRVEANVKDGIKGTTKRRK